MTALSAAIAVYGMTKSGLPVSTTQAIVGGIVGWNLFSGSPTDTKTLTTIVSTWFICPLLAAVIAITIYKGIMLYLGRSKLHLLRTDAYTRTGLILAGAFGAYSLGANNIANVVGVFIPASPFETISIGDVISFSPAQQLFSAGRAGDRGWRCNLFPQRDDDGRQRTRAHISRSGFRGCPLPFDRPFHVRLPRPRSLAGKQRAADDTARAGLQFTGSGRIGRRHRNSQRHSGHPLGACLAISCWAGWSRPCWPGSFVTLACFFLQNVFNQVVI